MRAADLGGGPLSTSATCRFHERCKCLLCAEGFWGALGNRTMLLALALLLANAEIVLPPHPPRLGVFDAGPVFNIGDNNTALMNASAHATSSALIVTIGERLGGE